MFSDLLTRLRNGRTLVDVRRDEMNVDDVRGLILDVSDTLLLIGVVSDDIQYDGYTVVDRDDVSFLRWGTSVLLGWEGVLGGLDDDLAVRDIALTDWRSAIGSIRPRMPLVAFHREKIDSRTCYLSDDFELAEVEIIGRQVTIDGEHDGSFAIRLGDLTRIDFGGRYEGGLRRMLGSA
jgi:hypothetical protein